MGYPKCYRRSNTSLTALLQNILDLSVQLALITVMLAQLTSVLFKKEQPCSSLSGGVG